MRKIPFLNLKALFLRDREAYLSAMERVLLKSQLVGGEELETFESNFARWVGGNSSVCGCGNGTDAITLAARSLPLPPGSEAIVPAMTFVATVEGLLHAGLKIRLVDISPDTGLMQAAALKEAITEKTKLLVPVHLYGQMAPTDEIRSVADRNGLFILEDAAQAHGARWKGKPVGYWGDIATYSFFPGKNLGAFGDAGAVLSRDKALIETVRRLSWHGGLKKYQHDIVGYNSRLDNLQAAILNVKLGRIEEWTSARRNIAARYQHELSGISGLTLPCEHPESHHCYHLYVVRVENREDFFAFMTTQGVEVGVHYPKAIHQLPCFEPQAFHRGSFPNAEHLASHGVSLPIDPTLNEDEIGYIVDTVKQFFRRERT